MLRCVVVAFFALVACGDNRQPTVPPDASPDAPAELPSGVLGIDLSPLELEPSFSPDIHDYVVRCPQAVTTALLTVTDASGNETTSLALAQDQLLLVREQYWVRCLPPDFPAFTTTKHPDIGTATPGWFLVNTSIFAIVFDTNGVPVWYHRGTDVLNVSSPSPNTIAFLPNGDPGPYSYTMTPYYGVLDLTSLTATKVQAADMPTDLHEFQTLPDGSHVLLGYVITPHHDLTGLGALGSDETMADCQIEVVDGSRAVVWSWLGSNHVDPVTESIEPAVNTIAGARVVDPFHCNSVEADANGNFLISMRHANAVFYVDRASGTAQWKLGGTTTNQDGARYVAVSGDPETTFSMQHDARLLANGHLTMFDNHGGATDGYARGVEYAVDPANGIATFVAQFPGIDRSGYEGSFRRYADGEGVIAWGAVPNDPRMVTEFNASGQVVLEISMPGVITYRAVKVPVTWLDIGLLRATAARYFPTM